MLVLFALDGSVVIQKATLQPIVTLSSTESEYMVLTEAAKKGIWLKGMISELSLDHDQAIVYYDSLGAICLPSIKFIMRTNQRDVIYMSFSEK